MSLRHCANKSTSKFKKPYLNLRQKQNQIVLVFQTIFSKNVLEKHHLVCTYNGRYFACTFIGLDQLITQLRHLSYPPYQFIRKQILFQASKMYPSLSFQLKITRSHPLQLNVARVCSRNVSCSASKSKNSNPTLNIERKGKEKQNTVQNQFFQKFMQKIVVEHYVTIEPFSKNRLHRRCSTEL